MAAILTSPAAVASRPGRLRGFASGAAEIDDAPVGVRGDLPSWLRGSLLMNGPALWDLPGGAYRHWFDGLAMLHRIRIGDGAARYRSRFLRSRDYVESVAAGRPARAGFGTEDVPGLWRRLRGVFPPDITDNAAVVMSRIAGRCAATTETPRAIAFDPDTLDTKGEIAFDDRLKLHLMAAHGIVDGRGTYWNVGIELGPTSTFKLFRVTPDASRREMVGSFACKEPGYLHAFAMTPRHALIWEPALRAQPLEFLFSGASYIDHFRWKPGMGSAIHAVSLEDGRVKTWQAPAMLAFHAVQAYEVPDGLVLELSVYDDDAVVRQLTLDKRRAGESLAAPRLARYRLRNARSEADPEFFANDLDLPQVHPSWWTTRRATIAWGAGGGGEGPFLGATRRIDLETGATRTWRRGGAVQLEPLFVAEPGADEEERGVLLVPTLSDDDAGSVVCVVDPASMQCMAELALPQVVPFGFHAAWMSA